MAVILERNYSGGGCIRVHDDYLPVTDAERRSAARAFELTVARLIYEGQIAVDGITPGTEVDVSLRKVEVGGFT